MQSRWTFPHNGSTWNVSELWHAFVLIRSLLLGIYRTLNCYHGKIWRFLYLRLFLLPPLLLSTTRERYVARTHASAYVLFRRSMCKDVPINRSPWRSYSSTFQRELWVTPASKPRLESESSQALTQQAWATWAKACLHSHQRGCYLVRISLPKMSIPYQ